MNSFTTKNNRVLSIKQSALGEDVIYAEDGLGLTSEDYNEYYNYSIVADKDMIIKKMTAKSRAYSLAEKLSKEDIQSLIKSAKNDSDQFWIELVNRFIQLYGNDGTLI